MPSYPGFYLAIMDVETDYLDKFRAHFASRHAPDLIAAGFHSVQAYYSEIGEPLIWNVYEIPGPPIFQDSRYTSIVSRDPQGPEILTKVKNRSNTIYEQALTLNVPESSRGITDPWLTTLRFDVAAGAEASLVDWYRKEEFPRLGSEPGFKTARLCRQNALHPKWPSTQPKWIAVSGWESREAALAGNAAPGALARHGAKLGDGVSPPAFNLVRRVFGVVSESR